MGEGTCATCSTRKTYADVNKGESLACEGLEWLGAGDGGSVMQCSACGALFFFRREYTYLVGGSEEDETLSPLDRPQAIAILLESALDERSAEGLRRLGVPDGHAAIPRRLEQQLDGDDTKRFYAVRKLIRHAVEHHDEAAIDRLLADTRPAVRARAVHELGQWRRALHALEDPDPSVQEAAAYILRTGSGEAVPPLAERLLKGTTDVRHAAALTLEVLVEHGVDMAPAFSALASVLQRQDRVWTRRAAARTLAKAARQGASRSALREVLARYVHDRDAQVDAEVSKEVALALGLLPGEPWPDLPLGDE